MKIRKGFVSNSSSSSFLVAFSKIPKTVDKMRILLFGEKEEIRMYDYSMTTQEIAKRVFNDLKSGSPLSEAEIMEELSCGYLGDEWSPDWRSKRADAVEKEFRQKFPGQEVRKDPEWSSRWREALDDDFAERRALIDELTKKFWETEKGRFDGKQVYRFHYSDNEGDRESLMEHGGIFDALLYIRISHH